MENLSNRASSKGMYGRWFKKADIISFYTWWHQLSDATINIIKLNKGLPV